MNSIQKFLKYLMFTFIFVIVPAGCFFTKGSAMIPREILFGNPTNTLPMISPDGKKLAYLAPVNNVLNVWLKTVGKDDDKPVTKDTRQGIQFFCWAQNGLQILFAQGKDGNENYHLYSVNINSLEQTDLTPFDNIKVGVYGINKHFPNELLIMMNKENPALFDAYHLDLVSGKLSLVAKNPGNIQGWLADSNFKTRGAVAFNSDGSSTLLVRQNDEAKWEELITWNFEEALSNSPVGFSKDGKYIYLKDSSNSNSLCLVKMEISTRKKEVIAQDEKYDLNHISINPDTYEPEAVCFLKARFEWQILDEQLKEDFRVLSQVNKGDLLFLNRTIDNNRWIVGFINDNEPISFYCYDRENKKATFIFYDYPELTKYKLGTMEPISFVSRDGLTIHGYITYPPGKSKKNLPLVLNVHGGPWARDIWFCNPEAQWLANRGYACLQINFRGSTGYGKEFLNAGNKEWGGKMHNDLVDAVNWATGQGIADPKKVAIFGWSYGGYAALVGATFTPDLFCCAVDGVGISNLITWFNTIPPYWEPLKAQFKMRVGDMETEEEFLKSRSPLFKANQIKIPVLIGQGANDPRVNQAESDQIVAAMQERGLEYEYLLFPDEGHGFAKPENRLKFYAAAEKFLAKNLGGQCESVE